MPWASNTLVQVVRMKVLNSWRRTDFYQPGRKVALPLPTLHPRFLGVIITKLPSSTTPSIVNHQCSAGWALSPA
tara:strand:- start:5399 stop:5620 length:222 start_codon:yes stop_codon:yes gene_type:complete